MTKLKKVYWLKLPKDFFQSKEMKKLQRRAGGDTYVKIYLKMLLLSLGDEGHLLFEQVEDSLAEQLSIEIDESVNDIEGLLLYLEHNKLITTNENGVFMDQIPEMIGSETIDAERKRRERNAGKLLKVGHCPSVSNKVPNIEIDIEKEEEIDKEIEIDREIDIEREQTNQSIKEYISLVSEATEVNLFQVQQAISLATLRNYDINMLILKIKESDFLLGKTDSKPSIRNFTQQKMLNLIMVDSYKNKEKKNEKKSEIKREVPIVEFDEESFLRGI